MGSAHTPATPRPRHVDEFGSANLDPRGNHDSDCGPARSDSAGNDRRWNTYISSPVGDRKTAGTDQRKTPVIRTHHLTPVNLTQRVGRPVALYPVAHICLPWANVRPLRCAIAPKAHSYRGPFRTEHLPVTGVTDADTELIGEYARQLNDALNNPSSL